MVINNSLYVFHIQKIEEEKILHWRTFQKQEKVQLKYDIAMSYQNKLNERKFFLSKQKQYRTNNLQIGKHKKGGGRLILKEAQNVTFGLRKITDISE